jgi:hypothetical protein
MNEMPRSDGENRIASFALSPKRLQQHPGGADEEEEEEEKEEEREKQRPSNLRLDLGKRPAEIIIGPEETKIANNPHGENRETNPRLQTSNPMLSLPPSDAQ